jgi:leader peptidase (prepilin peptidase)/N-methyltransferase
VGGGLALTALVVILVFAAGLVGLMVGSFLNVVIHRVPRGESVVAPRSRCPKCGTELVARDNVPLFSWLLLRGRCRTCAVPISVRYPLVELLTAVVFVLLALRLQHQPWALPAFLWIGAVGVALTLIDLDVQRLPDALTLPSYPVAVVLLGAAAILGAGSAPLVRAVVGGLALFALYLTLRVVTHGRGMGLGDVKLSGVLGAHLAWLGWGTLAFGAFGAFLLGGLTSVGLVLMGRAGRKTKIPFGPFMLAGALLAILLGGPLTSAYRQFTGI